MMQPLPLNAEFLFRLSLDAGQPQLAGAVGAGELRVVPVTGGRFEGPELKGRVVPGTAADWLRIEPGGISRMDVRLVLETDAGQAIYMSYSGIRTGPAAVLRRLAAGESVAPEEFYFRTAGRFETAVPELAWLNAIVVVGIGQRPPTGPVYDVYAIR